MMVKYSILGVGCALLMSGCTAGHDLQGQDPVEYYSEHPIENKVESRFSTQVLHLSLQDEISKEQSYELQRQINRVSPLAIDDVEIQLHPSHAQDKALHRQLAGMLVRMGVKRDQISVVPMEEVERHDANIQIAYSALVSPRCPDWRPSPVTSYSNMVFTPNIGCANVTNLGKMVADPRDMVEGSGDNTPDTANTSRAIQQYRSGESSAESSEGGSTGTSLSGATQ